MHSDIKKYLSSFELGKAQHFENMGVFPLFSDINHSPKYLILKDALAQQILSVNELDEGGSVPELKVINKGEKLVLLLDGEELMGAKQNRVLNTSILIGEESETVIPVSCTEEGRWSYVSKEFSDSGTVITPSVRMKKAKSVAHSLEGTSEFRADQGEVWNSIKSISREANVESETGAMRDVYEQKGGDLEDYLKKFSFVEEQKGLLTFIGGDVIGFDFVSQDSAFKELHGKLVKSYAMEAFLGKNKKKVKPDKKKAKSFIEETFQCKEKKYESVGKGWDFRYEGKNIVGSALQYRSKVIHTAFFRADEDDREDKMSGFRSRRRYRTG